MSNSSKYGQLGEVIDYSLIRVSNLTVPTIVLAVFRLMTNSNMFVALAESIGYPKLRHLGDTLGGTEAPLARFPSGATNA